MPSPWEQAVLGAAADQPPGGDHHEDGGARSDEVVRGGAVAARGVVMGRVVVVRVRHGGGARIACTGAGIEAVHEQDCRGEQRDGREGDPTR
jgi:hypothetical protein